MTQELKIVAGTSNPALAQSICRHLNCELTPALVSAFSDGEIRVEIRESIRGCDIFVLQSTCAPVNHNLMELCLIMDALKRASCGRITAVIPYYGYARQDRKVVPRAPISAKLVADFLSMSGMDRMVTVDLHAGQIQGFFDGPVDNIYASPVLLESLHALNANKDIIIVSPDAGGVERARAYAKHLGAGLAIIDKRRDEPNKAAAMHVIGDVRGKKAVVIDDMIDTAGTIVAAGGVLLDNGAKEVIACATHGVLSGPAIERLANSAFSQIFLTDTIPVTEQVAACSKIKIVPIGGLLASAIHSIHTETSVSGLFV